MTRGAQAARQCLDVIGADLAATANDRGPLRHPAHRVIGVRFWPQVLPLFQRVYGGRVLEKPLGDAGEAVGIGAEGPPEVLDDLERRRDRLGARAVDQNRLGGEEVGLLQPPAFQFENLNFR